MLELNILVLETSEINTLILDINIIMSLTMDKNYATTVNWYWDISEQFSDHFTIIDLNSYINTNDHKHQYSTTVFFDNESVRKFGENTWRAVWIELQQNLTRAEN